MAIGSVVVRHEGTELKLFDDTIRTPCTIFVEESVIPEVITILAGYGITNFTVEGGVPTFKFALTGQPSFFGTGTVGNTYLLRPTVSAYFASDGDLNAIALPAISADNPVQVQPLTYLATIQR